MKKLILLAPLLVMACTPIDRGRCLQSHHVHNDAYTYVTVSYNPALKMTLPETHYMPEEDYDVCDQWEFPNGRPKVANDK